jgi:hypothetical protein
VSSEEMREGGESVCLECGRSVCVTLQKGRGKVRRGVWDKEGTHDPLKDEYQARRGEGDVSSHELIREGEAYVRFEWRECGVHTPRCDVSGYERHEEEGPTH